MTSHDFSAILLILVLLSIPVMFVYGIYDCIKKGRIEEAEREQERFIAEEKLKIEMEKPKSRIRFIDSGREEHTTKIFDPYITTCMWVRNHGESCSVVSSDRVAGFALKEAYKLGYIRDANGNTYPTCNLHKISIEEVK